MAHAGWRGSWALYGAGFFLACGGDAGGGAGLKERDAGADARDAGADARDAGADARDAGADAASDASPPAADASAQAVTATALRNECLAACDAQSQCLQIPTDECASDCKQQAASLPADCRDEALAEQTCLAGLTCDEAKAYAVTGRRTHPVCGKAATAFFNDCTLGHGVTPQACSDLCAHYASCNLLQVSTSACEEQCVLQATNFDQQSGGDCSNAFLVFMACGANASCADAKDLLEQQLAPTGCEPQLDALNGACN